MFVRKYRTKVIGINQKTMASRAVRNEDKTWTVSREDLGWFVHMEGSHESLFVGKEKPTDLEVGQEVEVVLRGL